VSGGSKILLVLVLLLVIEKLKHSRIIGANEKYDGEDEYDDENDGHGLENLTHFRAPNREFEVQPIKPTENASRNWPT
jgi:hypothetical protein